jgi:hypothetical protein
MDNERPNEFRSWSRRLEEPGALPETGLADKDAAWDKLYDRLKENEPPRRKRMIWLWTAAACILLVVAPAALLVNRHIVRVTPVPGHPPVAASILPPHPVTPGISATHQPDPPPTARPGVHPSMAAHATRSDIRRASAGSSIPPTKAHTNLHKLPVPDSDTLNLVFAPGPDLSKPLPAAAYAPHAATAAIGSNLATSVATPKKEVRVVHINELEPPHPSPAMVRGPRQKAGGLRIGFNPQESFRPSTTYNEPESRAILELNRTQNP